MNEPSEQAKKHLASFTQAVKEAIEENRIALLNRQRVLRYLCNGYYCPVLKAHKNVSILIIEGGDEWEEAYKRWMLGKNPTDSPEWKKGVYFSTTKETVTGWSYN